MAVCFRPVADLPGLSAPYPTATLQSIRGPKKEVSAENFLAAREAQWQRPVGDVLPTNPSYSWPKS